MDLRDLRFHSLRDLPLQACCLKRQKIFFWAPPTKRNLIYQILQNLLFHRFVYKVWEIYFFKHTDLKKKTFFLPPHNDADIILEFKRVWLFNSKQNIFLKASRGQWDNIFINSQPNIKGSRGQRDDEIFLLRVQPIPEGVKGSVRKYFYLQPTK